MKCTTRMSLLFLVLVSCQPTADKTETLWVSGFRVACYAGGEGEDCFWVTADADPETGQWERLAGPVAGFAFEPGYLKQIEVKAFSDTTTEAYALERELDKREDKRMAVSGKWVQEQAETTTELEAPTLEISLPGLRVFGTDGCNRYFGNIARITQSGIAFGELGSTRKMCPEMEVADRFLSALGRTAAYTCDGSRLTLLDASGAELLAFIPSDPE